jgi:hypothetical protein
MLRLCSKAPYVIGLQSAVTGVAPLLLELLELQELLCFFTYLGR